MSRQLSTATIAKFVIGVFVVLIGLLAWQARHFTIDASAETLLVKDNRHYLLTQQANHRFSPPEFILIAVKPNGGEIFSPEAKTLLQTISQELKQIDRVESVNSLLNVPIFASAGNSLETIEPDKITWQNQDLTAGEMKKYLTNHPLYEDLLFNQSQTALALQVVFAANPALEKLQDDIFAIQSQRLESELSEDDQEKLDQLKAKEQTLTDGLDKRRRQELQDIDNILQNHRQAGEFYAGGTSLIAFELIRIIGNDLKVFGIAVSLIVCALIFVIFRELRWVFLTVISCGASILMTLGFLGALNLRVTVISANVIALQIILTLALIVHLIVKYREEKSQHPDNTHEEWVWTTLKSKVKPCFFAGLTTSIGFGSLIFSGIQPVISFGWMMVIAMAITLFVSLLLFPAILLFLPGSKPSKAGDPITHKLLSATVNMVQRHGNVLLLFWGGLTVLGLLGCTLLSAETSFLNYFRESTKVRQELTYIDQDFGGSTPLDIIYTVPENQRQESLVLTAATIHDVEAIQRVLAAQQAVGNITSIADFTRIAKTVTGKPLTEYELTVLYEVLDEDIKRELFSAYFSAPHQQIRISSRIQDSTPNLNREQLFSAIKADITEAGIAAENIQYTNLFVLYQNILQRLVDSQWLTLVIVYAAMGAVLTLVFSSLKVAGIALVPNIVTTAFVMGLMGFAGIPLDLMTITIAAIAMGISVDDTIHYIHRFLEEANKAKADAVKASHASVGYALTYTTTIIVIGFAALVFSDFMPSVYFGLLTGAAMIVALATDITLLPWLLQRYTRKKPA